MNRMHGMMILAATLLAGCVPNMVRQGEMAVYVFGPPTGEWRGGLPLEDVHVTAPSWLGSPAMQYRLRFDDAERRRGYTESRWAAPPAELLEQVLRRWMLARDAGASGLGCRLHVQLDELEQIFDAPESSRAVLAVRAVLKSRGDMQLARQSFILERTAPTADARGGLKAVSAAVQGLADEMNDWLSQVKQASPALAERCRG